MLDISFRSFAKKNSFWDSSPKFLPRCVNLNFFYVFQASKVPRQPFLEKCEKNSKSLHLTVQQAQIASGGSNESIPLNRWTTGGKLLSGRAGF